MKRRWDTLAAYYAYLGVVGCVLGMGAEALGGLAGVIGLVAWWQLLRTTPRWLDPRRTRSLLDIAGSVLGALFFIEAREMFANVRVEPLSFSWWLVVAANSSLLVALCVCASLRVHFIECELGLRDGRGRPIGSGPAI